tara:strand:+ start:171 stop:509 length:339 start_codon:yes stop_codon:yes gene_type:complete
MRKIETQMNTAIKSQKNWAGSNTTVITEDDISTVMLHGNHIATYYHNTKELALFDGGWQSNTTKSRLNALCYEFATGFSVFQKNWNWFVSDFQGKTKKDFVDGITVNYNGCF